MSRYLILKNNSVWPRPSLERDEDLGVEWKLRYAPNTLTGEDQLYLASIVNTYGYIICEATQQNRNQAISEIRLQLSKGN